MNFFEAQDDARKKTGRLAILFGAAVIALIVLTNLLVAVVFGGFSSQVGMTFSDGIAQIPTETWVWTSIGVVGVVAVASAYKFLTLRGGGRTIAEALGGRLVQTNTTDLKQRRLLNIVEEMAIASGIPVPPVYLIPEPSINAFAAGFGVDDAVVGINQGTLDLLSRSELQGVVAHEFSHILNGDTRINLRLIALLHGILFLGMVGYGLLRAGGYSRREGLPIVILGGGLVAIGYGGTFFGNLIKSAVSRQREYLADASAVQYTRNPEGIADALKKIGGFAAGSQMTSTAAEEASHMMFGTASKKFAGLFATHPPLDERIRAIEPNWDGKFPIVQGVSQTTDMPEGTVGFAGAVPAADWLDAMIDHVGNPDQESLTGARTLIDENPDPLLTAVHDPYEARALVFALLLGDSEDVTEAQLDFLEGTADRGVVPTVLKFMPQIRTMDDQHRLVLFEMAMPALKELSHAQYQRFHQNAMRLITADRQVDIFEWVLYRLIIKELKPHFDGPQRTHGRIRNLSRLHDEASELLSILACQGSDDRDARQRAFDAGARELGFPAKFTPAEGFDYQRLNRALGNLRQLRPLAKPALLKACAATVLSDETLTVDESALMQGIAATLDCPLPPDAVLSNTTHWDSDG